MQAGGRSADCLVACNVPYLLPLGNISRNGSISALLVDFCSPKLLKKILGMSHGDAIDMDSSSVA